MRNSIFFTLLVTGSLAASAEDPTTEAAPLQVTESPLVGLQQVGQDTSIATALQDVPGVVVTTQGQPVGQADLTIRGSSFSGAGLSIAGLSLRNPQTEHFHAELPFPASWLSQPTVLTGVAQAAHTEGHLTGTVLLSPLPMENGGRVTAGVDNKDGYWVNSDVQRVSASENGNQTGAGVFAGHTEIPAVDFPDNDVRATRGGGRAQILTEHGQGDLWIGHQDKTFGARGYYGVSDSLKAEERTQDTLLLGSWRTQDTAEPFSASFALRQFEDDYKLWLPTSLYRNQHRARTAAAQTSKTFALQERVDLVTRLAADIEDIDSNSLGDFNRSRLAATLLPEIDLTDRLVLSTGVRGVLLEGHPDPLLPLARLALAATDTLDLHVGYSQSVRRPSYTELNYESPGSLGNAGLELQEQTSWEAGGDWRPDAHTRLQAVVFQRKTYDTVDWVRPAAATRWQAENIGRVDTLGTEIIASRNLNDAFSATTSYMWLDKDAEDPPYSSRYTLDYARHFVRAQLDWTLSDWLRFELSQWWREQADNPLRTDGGNEQWLTNAAIHLRCPDLPGVQFSLMASNATDDEYRVFPGQDTVSARRVSAAVTVDW